MSEAEARAARLEAEREEHARAGAELRRALIAAGVLRPGDPDRMFEPAWLRSLPCLALDAAGRRCAAREQSS